MIDVFNLPDDRTLLWIGTCLYLVSLLYARISILLNKHYSTPVMHIIMTGGFVFQSIGLYNRGIAVQSFPLNNLTEILQVIAWSAVMLEYILRPAFRLYMLGFFTSAFAAGLGILSLSMQAWDQPAIHTGNTANPWISFHAALAVFSYGVFGLLALTSVMHLLQHYALRKKRTSSVFLKLPAITQLDEINKRLLLMGVSILTVAIGLGFANWAHAPSSIGTQKLLAALFVWFTYITAHWLRNRKKLIASHFSWSCICLFIAALLSLWPLNKHPHPAQDGDASTKATPEISIDK